MPNPKHPKDTQRYTFVRHLHHGGQGHTTLALDTQNGAHVVLKRLHMERLEDWKHVELFERESSVLQRLNHPSIPTHIDAFQQQDPSNPNNFQLVLVQQYIEGHDLERALSDGSLRMTEALARQLALEVLDILAYLHAHTPPIVHRDIKPANLIRNADGQLFLVDFGAVQEVAISTAGNTTVVGTVGYIAPEQMSGHAIPASDIYSLGITLIRLLTARKPHELPMQRMRIDFRPFVNISPDFANFLDRLIAPEHEDRPQNATEARKLLQPLEHPQQALALPDFQDHSELENSKITLEQTPERLQVVIPFNPMTLNFIFALCAFTVVLFTLYTLLTVVTLPAIFLAAFAPTLLFLGATTANFTTTLTLDQQTFTKTISIFGQQFTSKTAAHEFIGLRLVRAPFYLLEHEYLEITFDEETQSFGRHLTSIERRWLISIFDGTSSNTTALLTSDPGPDAHPPS